jgi:DNA-binding MarR family transcriptional regulator
MGPRCSHIRSRSSLARLQLVVDLNPEYRPHMDLTDGEFEQLLALRTGLRRFLHWSEEQAKAAGITPAQHQLLLAVRGHQGELAPTIGELASYLLLRPHSGSELIDRAVTAGLITRHTDTTNASIVRVALTPLGAEKLRGLSPAHTQELAELGPTMRTFWQAIERFEKLRSS